MPRWVWVAGAVVLTVTFYVLYRRRASVGTALNTSGTPGPDLTGSAAQEPTGGAASVPGNLPPLLVTQPDTLQQQVQQADASSSQSPGMIPNNSGLIYTPPPGYFSPPATGPSYTPPPGYFAPPSSGPVYTPPPGYFAPPPSTDTVIPRNRSGE